MKLNDQDRKQILNSILKTVEGISNKEYQQRVWIEGKGPECDDFDETVCNFFGDGDPLIEDYKKFELNQKQYQTLKNFRDSFKDFADRNYWPADFINTPEWDRITVMAKDVLMAFDYTERSI